MQPDTWTCEKCGAENAAGAEACARCGQPIALPPIQENEPASLPARRISRNAAFLIVLGAIAVPLAALAVYVTVRPPASATPAPSPEPPVHADAPPPAPAPARPATEDEYVAGAAPIWRHAIEALGELAAFVREGDRTEIARAAERLRNEFDGMRIKARDLTAPASLANVHYELLTSLERSSKVCEEAQVILANPLDDATRIGQGEVMRQAAAEAQGAYAAVEAALPELQPAAPRDLVEVADAVARLADEARGSSLPEPAAGETEIETETDAPADQQPSVVSTPEPAPADDDERGAPMGEEEP